MISLDFQPYCENCRDIEPEKEAVLFVGNEANTLISCRNRQKCEQMYNSLKERLNESKVIEKVN